jgi:hypothetical protein
VGRREFGCALGLCSWTAEKIADDAKVRLGRTAMPGYFPAISPFLITLPGDDAPSLGTASHPPVIAITAGWAFRFQNGRRGEVCQFS